MSMKQGRATGQNPRIGKDASVKCEACRKERPAKMFRALSATHHEDICMLCRAKRRHKKRNQPPKEEPVVGKHDDVISKGLGQLASSIKGVMATAPEGSDKQRLLAAMLGDIEAVLSDEDADVVEVATSPELKPVIELYRKGRERPVAYACGECGQLFAAQVKGVAVNHCAATCGDCGTFIGRSSFTVCDACRTKRRDERVRSVFDKAEKIPAADYDGWLFDDASNRYFPSVDEALEHYHFEEGGIPEYMWACRGETPSIDLDGAIQCAEENLCLEDEYDWNGRDELSAAVKKFNEAQTDKVYHEDSNRVVIFTPEKESAE